VAYDRNVAARVRKALAGQRGLSQKEMFGGLAFLIRGKMCCGVVGEDLMVRVGPDAYEAALSRPHVRQMDFTGKPMRGFVYVSPAGFRSTRDLRSWTAKAASFVNSLAAR
jgi:TfoX N-terminal domain